MPLPTVSKPNEALNKTGTTLTGGASDSQATKAASTTNPFASMKVTAAKNFVPAALIAKPVATTPDQ